MGQPREEAIERVEDHRDADEECRGIEVRARRVDNAGVAAKHVAEREQTWQEVHTPAEPTARAIRGAPKKLQPSLFVLHVWSV